MTKMTFNDMVSGQPFTKDVPVEVINSMEYVRVTIPLQAYLVLARWASVSRTLDNVEQLHQIYINENDGNEMNTDPIVVNILDNLAEELPLLHRPLDQIHGAIRSHFINLENIKE